jgi:hypothetical protein
MPNRFSSSGDYGQTFAYLYDQHQRSMEAAVQRVDEKREAELAAKDSLVFTRWQEGKISGGELMAYINQRMRQTSYDKAQQLRWREAAIQYGSQIADERAEAAYAQTGDINALIGHYASRLSATASGTPEATELAKRLQGLREQRDADNLRKQAKRITRAIERGDMTNKDLLAFYRDQLKVLPSNSPLREGVRDAISQLRSQMRDEQFQVAMTKIDTALATGQISPADAAEQKQAILTSFEIEARDPSGFWVWQEEIRKLRATPSPAEISQLEFDLAQGNISQEQYLAKIEEYANRIEPFDLQAAWNLRMEAQKSANEDKLFDPSALGLKAGPGLGAASPRGVPYSGTIEVVRNLGTRGIKQVSQMDGSAYADYNCTMAAGASLAIAMGYTGLSGADLRYLSGVTGAATNVQQLQYALQKAGVDGTRLSWQDRIGFEQFKERLGNGAPAVLSGWLGDIPQELNTSGIIGGHAMFVAGYDPKRDAFLMLDPAKSSDQGTWWPSSIVEGFGWGGERFGQALFAPRGTVNPRTLARVGGRVQHVSVNAPGRLPSTPPGAGGLFDPGPDRNRAVQDAHIRSARAEDRRLQQRLKDAGLEPGPELDTTSEVQAELARRQRSYVEMDKTINEWVAGFAEDGDDIQTVVLGSSRQELSRDDIAQMQVELIRLLDGQEILYDAIGDIDGAASARRMKAETVTIGVGINSIDKEFGIGRLQREANASLASLRGVTDPRRIRSILEDVGGFIEQLSGVEEAGPQAGAGLPTRGPQTEADEDIQEMQTGLSDEIEAQQGFYAAALPIIADTQMPYEEKIASLQEIGEAFGVQYPSGWPGDGVKDFTGDPAGRLVVEVMQKFHEQILLETIDPATGLYLGEQISIDGEVIVVPTKESRRLVPAPDGSQVEVPDREPVLDALTGPQLKRIEALGYEPKDLPIVVMGTAGGGQRSIRVLPDFVDYSGVRYAVWGKLTESQVAGLPDDLKKAYQASGAGLPLDDDTLALASFNTVGAITHWAQQGVIERKNFQVERILVPNIDGRTLRAWYKDSATRRWHPDNLPFIGRASDSPLTSALIAHDLTGMTIADNGKVQPQLTVVVEDADPTTAGVAAPYQDGLDPIKVGQTIRDKEAQGYRIDPLAMRDPDNPSVVITYTQDDDEYIDQWGKATLTIQDQVAVQQRARAEASDKLATVLPPEEAADMVFWDEQDKRERARLMGIDYDTGRWLPGAQIAGGATQPSNAVLDDLGIIRDTPGPKTTARFDPLETGLLRARGVAAQNLAEQAKARAAAVSTAKTGISTLPKVSTPIAKPPTGNTAFNPLDGARTAPTTTVVAQPKPSTGTMLGIPAPTVLARPQTTTTKPSPAPYMYGSS